MQFRSKKRSQSKQHNNGSIQHRHSRKQRQSRKHRQSRKQRVQLFELEGGYNWAMYEQKNKGVKEVINRNSEDQPGIKQLCRKLGFVNSRQQASLDILAEFINAKRDLFGGETWSVHLGSVARAENLVRYLQQTSVADAWASIQSSANPEVRAVLHEPGSLGHSIVQHAAVVNGSINLEKQVKNPEVALLTYVESKGASVPPPGAAASGSDQTLENGTQVVISGLLSQTQYNGQVGVIVNYTGQGKYNVSVNGKNLLVNIANLKITAEQRAEIEKDADSQDVECSRSEIESSLRVLKLPASATVQQASSNYKKLARETHPDRAPERVEEFKAISNAYHYLTVCLK
jgi:hypothetical protein